MSTSYVRLDNPIDALVKSLVHRFDRNSDGQLSTDEFATFLTNLLGGGSLSSASAPAAGSTADTSPASPLEGFDPAKIETSSSIKYQFARVARNYSLSSVTDKASAEALLLQMRPVLEREGMTVLEVSGDTIKIRDANNEEAWIDVIRDVDGPTTAWQWLDKRY